MLLDDFIVYFVHFCRYTWLLYITAVSNKMNIVYRK